MKIFETQKAGNITLRAVSQMALLDLLSGLGDIADLAADPDAVAPTNLPQAVTASSSLLTYAFGWGVVEDPPAEALQTLTYLNKPTNLPEIARANWLRYLVLDSAEASAALAEIVKLTFGE